MGALIGGEFALAGVFLAAWRERITREAEERARFQRETLKELLDTLEALMWDVQAIEQWRREPENWKTGIEPIRAELPEAEEAHYVGHPFDYVDHQERLTSSDGILERFTKNRLRMEKLANQVKDEQVRTQCYALSRIAREVVEKPTFERANDIIGPMSERIGALLRGESGVMIELGSPPDQPARYVSQRRLL